MTTGTTSSFRNCQREGSVPGSTPESCEARSRAWRRRVDAASKEVATHLIYTECTSRDYLSSNRA